jgi:hypothetical protein
MVADGVLYHATFARGLTEESFDASGWQLYATERSAEEVRAFFNLHKGAPYDWFSLLGFVLPWRVSMRSWMYCYEWCFLVLTGALPAGRITAEILLDLAHKQKGNPP